MKEKLVTTRDASHILGISEKEIIDLANKNLIAHFKLGGEFFRFKRDDLLRVRKAIRSKYNIPDKRHHTAERVREFFYFNDFYLAAATIIVVLLWFIVRDFVASP